jgi:hypothetical protein
LDPRTAILLQRIKHWNQTHGPRQQIDQQAELAVAGQEGLSGGIGDGGHAFGPNQLNDAGGVWTGRNQGLTPEQKNRRAWTPAGIDEALAGVARAAGGRHGADAVSHIVSDFERPRDPKGEIARALASLGASPSSIGGGAAPDVSSPAGSATAADPNLGNQDLRRQAVLQLISSIGDNSSFAPFLQALQQYKQSGQVDAAWGTPQGPKIGGKAGKGQSGLPGAKNTIAELLLEGTGGPTHSTGPHVHVASTNPGTMLGVIKLAQQLGLHVGENPYVGDTVDPVHAPNSFHKLTFPGLYNGRKLGEAGDFTGASMKRFKKLVQARYGAPTS